MNYKKIFKTKSFRLLILSWLNFIPNELMIKIQYRIKTGRKLNLDKPLRYTEKIQWYKLNYFDPIITKCSDKYGVREFVASKGHSQILNELYGVYDTVESINFETLPCSFAVKFTNGSGKNIFVADKDSINIKALKSEIRGWFTEKNPNYGREWGYEGVSPKIVIEALLERDSNNDIPDYKFFCFGGRVHYLYTMVDYVDNHSLGRCSFYDRNFTKLPYRRSEYMEIDRDLPKPKQFDEMLKIAEDLSVDFPHVRVDFYNLKGKIIFGELTFYNASGYTVFSPDSFDFIMGEKFVLPKVKLNK
jgi:hypothetical protein